MTPLTLPKWQSLRVRLPLLVSGTVAIVFALFLWTTRQELEQTLRAAAADRATAAAEQVVNLLGPSVARGLAEARRIASEPPVREFLLNGSGDEAVVRKALAPLTAAGQPAVELWRRSGALALTVATGTNPPPRVTHPERRSPAERGLSPFILRDNAVTYELIVDVDSAPDAAAGEPPLGVIVMRRTFAGRQNADAVRQLVGDGASVLLGNQRDMVWTDLAAVAAPPGVDATRDGVSEYRDVNGTAWIGALRLMAGTPWAVWVGFPKDVILAPADTVFRRMMLVAIGLVLLAAATIAIVSARLTRPLRDLTDASEAVAAGNFDRHVRADRGDEIGRLGAAFNIMVDRVSGAQRTLEQRVDERTRGLQRVNHELEAFSYSVSHDLRAPLRHVIGFSTLLRESGQALGDNEQRYITTIVASARRMAQLIDDLLAFSRVSRTELDISPVDLNQVVREAQREAGQPAAVAKAAWTIDPLPIVQGDRALLHLVMVNLLSNALKYSATRPAPAIQVGASRAAGEVVVFVRDNGVGFDMAYAPKLFGVFQRLHRQDEFEGTGIGLANVRRIIERHGGRTWAEGALDQGATFSFSLPERPTHSGGKRAND